nr:hypothetical protein [Tanacetum cinerariifolium]
ANTFKNFLGEQLERFCFGPPRSNLALDTTCHGVIVSTPREQPQLPTSVVPYRVSTRGTYYTLTVGSAKCSNVSNDVGLRCPMLLHRLPALPNGVGQALAGQRALGGENDVDLMKWDQSIYRDEHKGVSFSQEDAWAILKFHPKWDAPEQVDLTGDVPRDTQEDLFGHDARPRPAGASSETGIRRKGFRSSSRKNRTLMRLKELRFLATSTKDLDDDDAYWIKKQKRLMKNKMRNDLGDEDDEDESMMHKFARIDEDVSHRIKVAWLKWKADTKVRCDRNVPLKRKGKFYRATVRPSKLCGSECWPITKALANSMKVTELRMLW